MGTKLKSPQAVPRYMTAALALVLVFVCSAQATNKYRVLHYFAGRPAENPFSSLVADSAGNFYGTTVYRSEGCRCGVIFKLTRRRPSEWSYGVIYRFHGADGSTPMASLVFDGSGSLYGTTGLGGAYNLGTVFELTPSGNGWKEEVLYSFGATAGDLEEPYGPLTPDSDGNLYGTTYGGGTFSEGGVFELKRSGKGWAQSVLYSFTGGSDGGQPYQPKPVWDSAGNLYGTTQFGGQFNKGVVFELTPGSGGVWTESVLYSFTGGDDGWLPASGLTFDGSGNLYGTAFFGGSGWNCDNGCGTVFELTPYMGQWTFNVLHAFDGSDGGNPTSLVLDSVGNLYGPASNLDSGAEPGVVFKLSPSGNGWAETVLHYFNGRGGVEPFGGVVFDKQGILYGTAEWGGAAKCMCGVVFSLTP